MRSINCSNRKEMEKICNNFNVIKILGKIKHGCQMWTLYFI